MDLKAANRPTAAESALIEAYTAQVGTLPGDGAVMIARDKLFADLRRTGLPTRRVESWHYTDLKTLLRAVPAAASSVGAGAVAPLVSGSWRLVVNQGHAEVVGALPDGVSAERLSEALVAGRNSDGFANLRADDAIGRINGSFVTDGFILSVADGAEVETPLELQVVHAAGQAHSRFPASFGARTRATVIERHLSSAEGTAFVSSVSDLTLGDGAEVLWIIMQGQGVDDTHLGQIRAALGANAKLRIFIVNTGGKLVRQEVHVVTAGEGSDFTLRGVNLLGGDTHTDITMTLGHDVAHTTSTEIIRSVVFDRAHGVFQGMIRVAPDAQKTDARMACNTLLMSDEAEFAVKPELEIFADDVQCAHGATVADILKSHLYYLMSRGIPEKKARGLLINGFVAEIIEELEDEALVEALETVISDWLERHG